MPPVEIAEEMHRVRPGKPLTKHPAAINGLEPEEFMPVGEVGEWFELRQFLTIAIMPQQQLPQIGREPLILFDYF